MDGFMDYLGYKLYKEHREKRLHPEKFGYDREPKDLFSDDHDDDFDESAWDEDDCELCR